MRRQVKRFAVCLVVGVVVNVLVAWGAVFAYGLRVMLFSDFGGQSEGNFAWPVKVPTDWPVRANQLEWSSVLGVEWRDSRFIEDNADVVTVHCVCEVCCGVPFTAFRSWFRTEHEQRSLVGSNTSNVRHVAVAAQFGERWAWVTPSWTWILPVVPDRIGFIANTLIYSAACWSMLFGPGTARMWLCERRGQCVACGYDLTGLVRCPECGVGQKDV